MNIASSDDKDLILSRRALELASLGTGLVSPNPLVGCVITDAEGSIIGEGTYRYDRVTHAEVIALQQAGHRARGGTAYVSLEPHSHHGKTPPCSEALINAGIARVVCPIEDPNPLVSGKGFQTLRDAGVDVVVGLLADEATRLNEKFISWHKKGRPFVHLKLAMSLDGRISAGRGMSTTLSGEQAREYVQHLRHEYDAILVGGNTAAIDDPRLTDRSGIERRRPLVRVLLDNRLRLTPTSYLASTARDIPTIVFTGSSDRADIGRLAELGIEIIELPADANDLSVVLTELRSRDIQSVLVEGGARVAGSFINAGLVDKVTFLYAPVLIGGDGPSAFEADHVDTLAVRIRLSDVVTRRLGDDIEVTGYPE